ncbi:MAG: hypothetical protein HOB38_22470, partial [Deltaproteobacteria bacterium]|nr:hypothetical protein [Deltaproteobacteria bacterium]
EDEKTREKNEETLKGKDQPELVLLLDHDNIPFHKISLKMILREWFSIVNDDPIDATISSVKVRAYGGWFNEESVTESRFRAAEFYQASCPATYRHGGHYFRLSFEFADSLISTTKETPSCRITHTVATRSSAQYLKIRSGMAACTESDCQLRVIKKWIKRRRACPKPNCPNSFSDYFERTEQKQVDIHLAIDMLTASEKAHSRTHIAIASDDWDLLPAIGASALRLPKGASVTSIRFHNEPTYFDGFMDENNIRIIRVIP